MGAENFEKKLNKVLSFLKKKYSPQKIILFGSRATKNYLKHSDIDLLIISDSFTEPNYVKRLVSIYEDIPSIGIGIDILPFTPTEFKERKKTHSFIKDIIKKGKVIYSS